jgi:hypothetical protein
VAGGRHATGWEVHEQPGGTFDVKLNGRPVQYDCEDLYDAQQVIRGHREYARGDPIALVERDGYRRILVRGR